MCVCVAKWPSQIVLILLTDAEMLGIVKLQPDQLPCRKISSRKAFQILLHASVLPDLLTPWSFWPPDTLDPLTSLSRFPVAIYKQNFYRTIRSWAKDFYVVIVDETESRKNCHHDCTNRARGLNFFRCIVYIARSVVMTRHLLFQNQRSNSLREVYAIGNRKILISPVIEYALT